MEMTYHRLTYLLILHHWDHMHNTNHKDFSRVVTGFRIKVGNIWECSSKAIETSGVKNESTQARINKTRKTNHSIQQLLQFGFKAFKPCKTPTLKKRSFKRNTFHLL